MSSQKLELESGDNIEKNDYASKEDEKNDYASNEDEKNNYASHEDEKNDYASHEDEKDDYASHEDEKSDYTSHEELDIPGSGKWSTQICLQNIMNYVGLVKLWNKGFQFNQKKYSQKIKFSHRAP